MRFKKIGLGFLLGSIAAPLFAMTSPNLPDLIINNNTNEPSTVKIVSGAIHACSGQFPGGTTAPHETNHVKWALVNLLCIGSGNLCVADIFATSNCGSHDKAVGQATLNTSTGAISINAVYDPKYVVFASGSTVNVKYAD